ncbi:MAG: recombinase family protein [Chloroflexota bacterium]|nr:recombinase family protein [Chloroflexota bacterium]
MRAAIYTRVSSKELQADGYSLAAQERTCRRLAKSRDWEIAQVFTDTESARTTDRPSFKKMLRQAEAGRFGVLIVHKLDRFSRSVVDQLNAFDALTKAGVGFVSATEGNFDFSTPAGRLQMTVLGAVNEWYVNNLSAEVSKGLKARAEAGMWLGEVPYGYDCDYKKDGGNGLAYPNEEEAEGVRLAFRKYATGSYSYRDVAEILNQAGYRPRGRGDRALSRFSKDTINVLLTNRFYIGDVEYKGEHYPGLHEPIVSRDLFDRVQDARTRRTYALGTRAPANSRIYPLTGIARCARCGAPMRGSLSSGRRYYRDPAHDQCRGCDQPMVRALEAEAALRRHLQALSVPLDWRHRLRAMISETRPHTGDVEESRRHYEEQLDRLKQLYIVGDISRRSYERERDGLQSRLVALNPLQMPLLAQAADLLENIDVAWEEADPRKEKQIAHTLLQAVYLDSEIGPVVGIEPKHTLKPLFQLAGCEQEACRSEAYSNEA